MGMPTRSITELNPPVGFIAGFSYLLVGLAGFATHSDGFAARTGGAVLGTFQVNPLHSVVHVVLGALLVSGARAGGRAAALVNLVVGGIYLIMGGTGLFVLGSTSNILAINGADNVLHFATAALLTTTGLAGRARPA
jgi:hypothetical protein